MKRRWTEEELIERWTLAPEELALVGNKSGATRLGFAVFLRFFAGEGRFPKSKGEVSGRVVAYLGRQVGVGAGEYLRYDWQGRAIKYHRAQVRAHFGFREAAASVGLAHRTGAERTSALGGSRKSMPKKWPEVCRLIAYQTV